MSDEKLLITCTKCEGKPVHNFIGGDAENTEDLEANWERSVKSHFPQENSDD